MVSDISNTNEILLFLTENSDVIGTVSDILIPILGVVVAGSVYLWNKKKNRLAYIQQSFDDLQLINQLIL